MSPFAVFRSGNRGLPEHSRAYKDWFDTHHGVQPRAFLKGEKITVVLDNKRRIPATFVSPVGKVLARVRAGGRVITRHRNQIWKRSGAPLPDSDTETDEFLSSAPEATSCPEENFGE